MSRRFLAKKPAPPPCLFWARGPCTARSTGKVRFARRRKRRSKPPSGGSRAARPRRVGERRTLGKGPPLRSIAPSNANRRGRRFCGSDTPRGRARARDRPTERPRGAHPGLGQQLEPTVLPRRAPLTGVRPDRGSVRPGRRAREPFDRRRRTVIPFHRDGGVADAAPSSDPCPSLATSGPSYWDVSAYCGEAYSYLSRWASPYW